MRTIKVIGIGAGHPDHLTVQAVKALNATDVVFIPDKGAEKADLARLRAEICRRFITRSDYRTITMRNPSRNPEGDYRAGVDDWHATIADNYRTLFASELAEGQSGALLVWGDPSLYDSTIRILDRIRATGFPLDYEVVPGISSVQALAARHRIALNRIGGSVLLTTGRRLADDFPGAGDSVVVMLDGEQAFRRIDPNGVEIHWGAYLGTPDEILIAGKLAEVADEIGKAREAARTDKGWIMDTYLLRKSTPLPEA